MKSLASEIINTPTRTGEIVDQLVAAHESLNHDGPSMYLDLEGVNLCRSGSISILTLLLDSGVVGNRRVYLLDVHELGARAFTTAGAKGKTLQDILQDEKIPKVFFDVRNDSDALFALYGVALRGVEDVQLMESAARKTTAQRRLLNGLARCVESNQAVLAVGGRGSVAGWKQAKQTGERLFKPEMGGSYAVFNTRPIPKDIVAYAIGDVQFLPDLRNAFWKNRTVKWRDMVLDESKKRVALSQRADYQPHGRDRALAPWSKEQNTILDQWNYTPAPRTDLDDFFGPDDDPIDDREYDWDDIGPTSCRDVIDDWDMHYYYSD
jgi:exonuclease 3'-5' domain-containing protein 1